MPVRVKFILTIVLFVSCSREPDPKLTYDPGKIVAMVNGSPIYSELFEETYVTFLSRTGFNDTPDQRYGHLNVMIDTWLMADEAKRRKMNDAVLDEYHHKTRQRTLRNLFLKHNFSTSIDDISDPEVRLAYYRTHQKPYVRQLFFTEPNRAEAFYLRLENGEDFVDLANELYLTMPYDSLAGYIGEINYYGVDDAFAEAAFQLNAGEYSKPVRTRQGYVIIRVDNWNLNPIVTETQYLNRRDKIRFSAYQRNFNLGADDFVRDYMASLNPQPERTNLQQVYLLIQRFLPPSERAYGPDLLDHPIQRGDHKNISDRLDPMLPLVTFTVNNNTQRFLLKDYMMWMEFLPYQEVVHRFDASVGRALMWDVFAKQAVEQGLDRNPFVDFNAESAGRFFQASRLTDSLRSLPAPEILADDIETAFELFGMGGMARNTTSFWYIHKNSFNEARELRDKIQQDGSFLNQIREIQRFTNVDAHISAPEISRFLLRAVPDQVLVAGTGTDWYVFQVLNRKTEPYSLEERRDEIIKLLEPSYSEFLLLRDLRNNAAIRIDTSTFSSLMSYYPANTGY